MIKGVKVTVLLAPDPPKTILDTGISAVFEDPPVNVRLVRAVSASPMVNVIAEVAVSSFVDKLAIFEIVGVVFTIKVAF